MTRIEDSQSYNTKLTRLPKKKNHQSFQESGRFQTGCKKEIAVNTKMTEMLELSDKNFKATMI